MKATIIGIFFAILILSGRSYADNYGILSFENTITAGNGHVLFISKSGDLYSFGKNDFGQLGDGSFVDKYIPVKIMEGVKGVYAGKNHSLVIDKDDNLWAFGSNEYGELGDGTNINKNTPVMITENVKSASAGDSFSLIVKKDYTLWSFGLNDLGQLGIGSTVNSNYPVKVLDNIIRASAGLKHSLVVSTSGSLFVFGDNSFGQLGDGTLENKISPTFIISGVFRAEAGATHSLTLGFDRTLHGFGNNFYGQLGLNDLDESLKPKRITGDVVDITSGLNTNIILKKDGFCYIFGTPVNKIKENSIEDKNLNKSPKQLTNDNADYYVGLNDEVFLLKYNSDLYRLGRKKLISSNLAISDRFLNKYSNYKVNLNIASELKRLGIFNGRSKSFFIPDLESNMTSFEALAMLGRVFNWKLDKNAKSGFSDVPSWAEPYVAYAKKNGISSGVSKKLFGADYIDNKRIITWILAELGLDKNSVWNNTKKYAKEYGIVISDTKLKNDLVYLLYKAHLIKNSKNYLDNNDLISNKISVGGETKVDVVQTKEFFEGLRNDYEKYRENKYDKVISFTFDDGPSEYTSYLLDSLKEEDSKATFFVLGSSIYGHENLLKRINAEGHEIGNHSFNHPDLSRLSFQSAMNQIDSCDTAIKNVVGFVPKMVRPPYGAYNSLVLSALKERGKSVILWNVDTKDWANHDAYYVKNYILSHLEDGNIVLLHDIHKTSVDGFIMALPEIKARGYKLVTVSDLLRIKGRNITEGSIYFSGKE